MSPTDDVIAALHESAHGCFCAMKGWDVKEIVLHKIGARADEQGHTLLYNTDDERSADPVGYALFLLVAAAAERRQTGAVSMRCSHDYEIARTWIAVNLNKDLGSADVARELAACESIALATVQSEPFWSWVQRTSRALIRRRRLTGYDLQRLRDAS